jgi:D-glycero-alpha-D-manno-heptose-7-phosphate kinase
VDLYANVTLSAPKSGGVELRLDDSDRSWTGPAGAPLPIDGQLDLLKGVYNRMCADFNGGQMLPLAVNVYADVPPGSGLGTSSAMVVALVQAFSELFQARLSAYDVAHLAYEIERLDLKLNGGKQDQYAAAFGGVNFIEFGPGPGVLVNPLRVSPEIAAEFESSLVLFFSGVSRESARIIDEQTRNVSSGEAASIEAMHRLKAVAYQMKQALLKGRIAEVGAILDESWEHKKRTASAVTTPELDAAYYTAKAAGAFGGKVSGAGGGGFMMFLVDPRKRHNVLRALEAHPGRVFASGLTHSGVMSWRVGEDLRKAASLAA